MELYIGGPHAATIWRKDMDLYLVSTTTLWGLCNEKPVDSGRQELAAPGLHILESFFYVEDWMLPFIDDKAWNFMLDSGAYTFMNNSVTRQKYETAAGTVDWDSYVCRYADFILQHDIDKFFELDIDNVVGLKRVEQLRDLLEHRTSRRCIPVWHKARGLANWKATVKEYPYVAIGGIVSGEIKRTQFNYLNAMCDVAHQQGTRVHGLGVSPSKGLEKLRFDSVDSTSWTMGNRAGHLDIFTGTGMRKVSRPPGTRMKAREAAIHNFREWVKYQRYMLHAGWKMES